MCAIDATKGILADIRKFNKESWVIRYPQFQDREGESSTQQETRRGSIRRSLSFADDPTFQADVVVNSPRKGITRSVTLATITDEPGQMEEPASENDAERLVTPAEANDFHVFRLDLKLGSHGSSSSPASLVTQLE